MKKSLSTLGAALIFAFMISCSTASQEDKSTAEESQREPKITLAKAPASPEYADAALKFINFSAEQGESNYTVNLDFEVNNYELGAQTETADSRGIANSGKGQHIHLILNNGPYSAHYETSATKQLEEGNYVALAFLSRSYHESVKNENSYWIDVITVGEPEEKLEVDFSAPHMFYSRPKGTYAGKDTEKLMIDFFLLNTELSPEGNKVRATVNGEVFLIDEWAPFYVEGLPKGDIQVKLELIDVNGEVIPGPFNVVERTVKLVEAEA
jgi:hypothetical protein